MSALTSPPAKILLSSSTKVSLHDRFTKLAKSTSQTDKGGVIKAGIRPASAKNRKLAIQMASRPSVQAALRIKNKSIRQQIGQAKMNQPRLRNRFKINNNTNNQGVGLFKRVNKPRPVQNKAAGFDPSRLSIGGAPFMKPRNLANRLGAVGAAGGNMNNRIRRVGAGNNGRGRFRLNRSQNQGGVIVNRSPNKGNRRFNTKRLGNNNQQQQNRGRQQNRRGNFRRRGNNRSQQSKQQQQPKSKENLDMDLDQYMAKSKSHLDNDLDQYMAQANTAGNTV